jgi:tRNA (cmo5U34)-methyltransferase
MTNEAFKDEVVPGEKWAFDEDVARCFDDMLARSIPGYEMMRDLTTRLALRSMIPGTAVVDLGCSRGEAMAPLVEHARRTSCTVVGVETSEPMLAAARARFAAEEWANVRIVDFDLRRGYPQEAVRVSVTLCVLSLQFTPIEHRLRILRDVWKSTVNGGCLLLVEKVIGSTADVDRALVEEHLAEKRARGYSQEQIDRKRASLEGVLVPVTAAWNEDLLRSSGFSEVDCYWRILNFAGWIATK